MKADNPFFYLPSSQLFPLVEIQNVASQDAELINQLKLAKDCAIKQEFIEALAIYDRLIEQFPDLPFLYACRSLLKSQMEEEEGAFYDYQVAKRLDFNYHIFLEWIENSGQMLESEELLELMRKDGGDEQFYINRATLFVQHFEYEKAILDFSKAYELGGKPTVLISRGAVNMRMLRYDRALTDFNEALKKDDTLVQGYILRAKLYASIQEIELAEYDFNTAVNLSKDEATAYEERAQFFEQTNRLDLAIEDYSTVIDFNSDDFYVYVLRADLYEKQGKLELALSDYSKAITLNPYYSDLYQYRGDIRQSLGDLNGAKEDYAKFEELEEE